MLLASANPWSTRSCLTTVMNGPRLRTIWPLLVLMAPLPCPESTVTTAWCAVRLTWTQILAAAGLVMILCTVLWMKPVTALAICGPNVLSSELIRVSPLSLSWAEAESMVPVRLSWLVICCVILSVRTFWMAGSWISGSTVATQRPVSDTSLPAQTPSTATGPRMQPRTMSTMETGVRQLKRRRRGAPALSPRSLAVSSRRRSSSARSSGPSSWPSVAPGGSPPMADTVTSRAWLGLRHPAEQVLADPDGVGHGGEGRVHRPDAGEEAGVHDVQVVQLVGLAVDVEHRRGRVVAEPAGPGLVGAAGDRDAHVHVEVLVEHVVLGHPDVVEDLPELVVEPGGLGGVGRGVGQVNAPVAVHGHAVAGLGHVLSGQPEVHGVTSHVRQAPVRRQHGELGLLALHRLRVRLPAHLDVPERPFAAIAGEVEVVQAEGLLEHRVVALLAQGDHGFAVVIHVVAADLARAVGQAIRVP